MTPPVAKRVEYVHGEMGEARADPWHWLKDRDDPDTIAYLEAENQFAKAKTQHTEPLRKALYEEMLARIQEDDTSAPYRKGDWWYYHRTESGRPYQIYCRKRDGSEQEEVILDVNEVAKGHEYTKVGGVSVSPDHARIAFSEEHDGSEVFSLIVRDLATGEELSRVEGVYYGLAWANDSDTVFFTTLDHAHRPWRLHRHTVALGQSVKVFEEPDERFFLSVKRLRSGRFLAMSLSSHTTSEVHLIDTDAATTPPALVRQRVQDVEYTVDHQSDRLVICTNADDAVNFKLVEAPLAAPHAWTDLEPYREDVYITDVLAFESHLAVFERRRGLPAIRVVSADGGTHDVTFPEAAYKLSPDVNPEFGASAVRFSYSSPITSQSVFAWDMVTQTRTLLKQEVVLGDYDPSRFVVERIEVPSHDGTLVPIAVTRRRDVPLDGTAPGFLRGYGSYGMIYDPSFSYAVLSLLERGVVYATAAIRGGGELGRGWYHDGKLMKKQNTFEDFSAAAEGLLEKGYVGRDRLAIYGGSAGGLLIGAVLNQRPELFRAAVADVPFVDSLNTMLDDQLPLTVIEYEEWGDPNDAAAYAYMKSYAPYENLHEGPYPNLLVLAGLNDPRVGYWEPAKWVAKLRATARTATLLLKTEMGAGHAGKSGRYGRLDDIAYIYAFVLDCLEV